MTILNLPSVPSTNTWMLDALSRGESFEDETVVFTTRQTCGRGQVGNSWVSDLDKNIAFSLLIKPAFLPITRQFLLSEVCCLGVVDGLKMLCNEVGNMDCARQLCIKWPNDIYMGDEKLGGILIENRLMGSVFSECVLGVGLNVNQTEWGRKAPNPTSLCLHGIEVAPEMVLEYVLEGIISRYRMLKASLETYSQTLHKDFINSLYRGKGLHPYVDVQSGEQFLASISDIDPRGPIVLQSERGEIRRYWFKEVHFVLPCGTIKE